MWQAASDGITYLLSQSGESLLRLFWFVAIFEIPRYTLGFVSVAAAQLPPEAGALENVAGNDRVTVLIAGHNEAKIDREVRSFAARAEPSARRDHRRQRRLHRSNAGKDASIARARIDQGSPFDAGAVGQVRGSQFRPAPRHRRGRRQSSTATAPSNCMRFGEYRRAFRAIRA